VKQLVKAIKVEEVEAEGLVGLLGQKVMLMCMNYNYAGTLDGVNDTFVKLSEKDAKIVYDTGEWTKKDWADSQSVGQAIYVERSKIEAFFLAK